MKNMWDRTGTLEEREERWRGDKILSIPAELSSY